MRGFLKSYACKHVSCILVAIFALNFFVTKAEAYRIRKDDRPIANIKLQTEIEEIIIEKPWSTDTAFEVYSNSIGAETVYNVDSLDLIMTVSMFLRFSSAPIIAAQQFLIDPLPKATREQIKAACLEKYEGSPWELLVCTNQSVTYIVAEQMGDRDRDGLFTACRAISSTVQLIFNSYNIPRARVSTSNFFMRVDGGLYGHSINTVTFTSSKGGFYGYTFDAASPSSFFPNTEPTIRFHEKNGLVPPQDIGMYARETIYRPRRDTD